jgi:hypothetical protein
MFNLKTVQSLTERKKKLESNPAIANLKAKLSLYGAASGSCNILLKSYIQSIVTLSLDDLFSKYKSIEINTDMLCSAVNKGESDLQTFNSISKSGSGAATGFIEKFKLPEE